jgi:pimeloyl-ACP methyl ester carboxylesterase
MRSRQIRATTPARTNKLDAWEEHFRISSGIGSCEIFLRYLPALPTAGSSRVMLYVHGATFPSALSIAHRFDGRSWRDELVAAGYHVWGVDFLGFGESDRYPAMELLAEANPSVGRAPEASHQIEHAVRFIAAHHRVERISIIAHSWGTIATGLFATQHPELVDRLVFFGPITQRQGSGGQPPALPAWRLITLADQWKRFVEDVPAGESPVLSKRHFDEWGKIYLATDPESDARSPASVKTPSGPIADIFAAWHGHLAYDPAEIKAPTAIVRGEWDSLVTDADARWLFEALSAAPIKRDVKISRGTHLMHLEAMRFALYRESIASLQADDETLMERHHPKGN